MKKLLLLLLLPAAAWSQTSWKLTGNAALSTDFLGTTNAEALKMYTNNAERLRISSTGNVGLGTSAPHSSALLDMTSTTQGMLVPRMTKAQRDAIISPATGLLIYQTNSTPGFYYNDGSEWKAVAPKNANKSLSNLTAPTAVNVELLPQTDSAINLGSATLRWKNLFAAGDATINGLTVGKGGGGIGTNTAAGYAALYSNTTGYYNTAAGYQSLFFNTTGVDNTAAGGFALYSNTTGNFNTAAGFRSLYSNTTGYYNTAAGYQSLYSNTTGYSNTAAGFAALNLNTTGYSNTAAGYRSLNSNTTGSDNMAAGSYSLYLNTEGNYNTAAGSSALYFNTTGTDNTAAGGSALYSNTTGNFNTASGYAALYSNTTGNSNAAAGYFALLANTTGFANTASGYGAGSYNDANTYCTFIGYDADQAVGTDFTNSTALGNSSRITASDQVRIGNSSVTSIGGYANWTNVSDGRYKRDVQENVPGLAFINKLRPVTYHLDVKGISRFLGEDVREQHADKEHAGETVQHSEESTRLAEAGRQQKESITYTGFIAQEVEEAAAELGYEFSGVDKPQNEHSLYGLRYAEFVVPLVKAVQELSASETALRTEYAELKDETKELRTNTEALQTENAELKARLSKIEALLSLTGEGAKAEELKQSTVVLSGGAYLQQNVPNPFDGTTLISYYVPEEQAVVQLQFTSAAGEVLQTIEVSPGKGTVTVHAGELTAGAYQYSLLVNGRIIGTRQMVIQK
jgi:hypothetical protein